MIALSGFCVVLSIPAPGTDGAEYRVSSDAEFSEAEAKVRPGDVVQLEPGDYGALEWSAEGAPGRPIHVRGMTAGERTKGARAERRIQALEFGGTHTVFDGFRFLGVEREDKKKGPGTPCALTGHNLRLVNCTFDNAFAYSSYLSTSMESYECEIDHCLFANKEINRAVGLNKGMTIRIFGGKSHYPAGHVLHHNAIVNIPKGGARNGYEGIQCWSVGLKGVRRMGDWSYEDDTLIACNLFENYEGEQEMLSLKSDGVFVLLNTARNSREVVLRIGRNHTVEGNFFLQAQSVRALGPQMLVRNNYLAGGAIWFNCTREGRVGLSDSWVLNNTCMKNGFILDWKGDEPMRRVALLNNLVAAAPGEPARGHIFLGHWRPNETWDVRGNLFQNKTWGDHLNVFGKELDKEKSESRWRETQTPSRAKAGFREVDAKLTADKSAAYTIKEEDTEISGHVFRPAADSPVGGAAIAHPFVGGLDAYGNPVPVEGADAGAIQARGQYNIFNPLTRNETGPFTQKGEAPLVRFLSPAKREVSIKGELKVKVEASDPEGKLAYVYLMLNNQPVSVDTEPPFEWTITKGLWRNTNRLRAVAFDRDGNLSYAVAYAENQGANNSPRGPALDDYPPAEPECSCRWTPPAETPGA